MHHACYLRNIEAAKLLIDNGADWSLVSTTRQKPLDAFMAGSAMDSKEEKDKFLSEYKAAIAKKTRERLEKLKDPAQPAKEIDKLSEKIESILPPPPSISSRKGEDSEKSELRTALPLMKAETSNYEKSV